MARNKSDRHWENAAGNLLTFVVSAGRELFLGIKHSRIDIKRYVLPGTIVAFLFALNVDRLLAYLTGYDQLRLNYSFKDFIVYGCLSSGWIVWSFERAMQKSKLLKRLQETFTYCGLIAHGRLPSFIDDTPIDSHVRELKLFTQGIPLFKFLENKEAIGTHLNVHVVKMNEDAKNRSLVNITYATKDLENPVYIRDLKAYVDGEIPIGLGYEGPIHVNLRDVGHLLVAGQTTGGKSNFLKVLTATLCLNNPDAEIYFLDFKGGMELADLTNHLGETRSNFLMFGESGSAARELAAIGGQLDARLHGMAAMKASNFDEYLKRFVGKGDGISKPLHNDRFKRRFIVVDEVGELYGNNPRISKAEGKAARDALNKMARQGRAAGLHLIISVQVPDSRNIDQTVKANLPGVVCFPMVSHASSVSAIGTKRAFDLNPEVKGRAVWKYGPKLTEVQTYLFQ